MKRLSGVLIAMVVLAGCSSGSSSDSAATSSASPRSEASVTSSSASGTSGTPGATTGASAGQTSVSPLVTDGSVSDVAVSQAQFKQQGRTWPLKVQSGTLSCLDGTQIVFKTDDGTVYAVNDAAKAAGEWEDISAIVGPNSGGVAKVRADLTAAGAGLCG